MTANPSPDVRMVDTKPDTVITEGGRQSADQDHTEKTRGTSRRAWWAQLLLQPLLLFASGIMLFATLGVAQRFGLLQSGHPGTASGTTTADATRYICPMMCTPPQSEPGRCPVCAMELVPATAGDGDHRSHSVEFDPAARRLANIHTTPVQAVPYGHQVRAVGQLNYDESKLKSLTAYVDGRIERLFADYTGVTVQQGDRLALVYSPELYSGQVELLLAKQAQTRHLKEATSGRLSSGLDLYRSARERLLELGMTPDQIHSIETSGEANSRMHLFAPMHGTVIEKLAVEGEYVRQGQTIYRLADLTSVWLMLELFPEDAASITVGQHVDAILQSIPGETFPGQVAFIDPMVNTKTRTVGVRVAMDNRDGRLRIGDYANATIQVSQPFTEALVVPRSAVLMAGDQSVVYVETTPGRFEIRRVVLGPEIDDTIVLTQGVVAGEQVATRGNFLIDSQMQLVGNPSVIDPAKAELSGGSPSTFVSDASPEVVMALAKLPDDERHAAEAQRICPVTEMPLGSMGVPPKVMVDGRAVYLCCEGCRKALLRDTARYLAVLDAASDELKMAQRSTPAAVDEADGSSLPPIAAPIFITSEAELPELDAPALHPRSSSSSEPTSAATLPPYDLPFVPMEELR